MRNIIIIHVITCITYYFVSRATTTEEKPSKSATKKAPILMPVMTYDPFEAMASEAVSVKVVAKGMFVL
jgi:hypothetical protein